jgi:hypothetical protein
MRSASRSVRLMVESVEATLRDFGLEAGPLKRLAIARSGYRLGGRLLA